MAELPEPWAGILGFDWDEHNARKIREQHGVEPGECEEVLLGEPRLVRDAAHSNREARYVVFGATATGRRLAVVFTIRGSRLRIVTARDQSRRERRELGDV